MRGKPITRRTVLSRRDAMPAEARAAGSEAIAERVEALLDAGQYVRGSLIALYSGKGTEVETTRIDASARSRGLRVVYPRVVAGQAQLSFAEARPHTLVAAKFGLREPALDAVPVEVRHISVFIVPGLAFDRGGGRVGWGRGYYDATLAAARPGAVRIGVAFECQVLDEVPRDAHDALLHYVVTEANTYRGAAD
jgi:5-formyltetrahydrofolate cyclo-ligase